jgi:hypothetical protein
LLPQLRPYGDIFIKSERGHSQRVATSAIPGVAPWLTID